MSSPSSKTFRATLEPDGTGLQWTIARLPFDFTKVWPVRNGRRVKGEINGFAFRTSLFPDPRGAGQILLVNKKMQAGAGVRRGDRAEFRLGPDMEERETLLPEELLRAMRGVGGLKKWFDKMSPSHRREIGKYVAEPKSAATREKRAGQMAERLYLAMEGEKEPPPILRAAFQRQPVVETGWKLLTPAQRRGHLLGIFYYQTPEARDRRAQAAIADALKAAKRAPAAGEL